MDMEPGNNDRDLQICNGLRRRIDDQMSKLQDFGLDEAEIKRATDPMRSWLASVEEEMRADRAPEVD